MDIQIVQFRTEDIKHKELSKRQKLWIERSRILWRLKGMPTINLDTDALTEVEKIILGLAFNMIKSVCNNSTDSSIKLGFNAKPRCKSCGRPLDKDGKCSHCDTLDYQVYRLHGSL